jgi:hypothetical protein
VPHTGNTDFNPNVVLAVMLYSAFGSSFTCSTITHKQCGGHISWLYSTTNRLMGYRRLHQIGGYEGMILSVV